MQNEIVKLYRQHAATAFAVAAGAVLVISLLAPLVSGMGAAFETLNSALGGNTP